MYFTVFFFIYSHLIMITQGSKSAALYNGKFCFIINDICVD